MSAPTLEKPLTYEEERGKPMPSRHHGAIQANLIVEFAKEREFRVYSELTLEFEGQSYTPDISVYRREPLNWRHDEVRVADPPLLVVEIVSPIQGDQNVMDKVEVYFRNGVKSCWIVSPPFRTVTILQPDGQEEVVHADIAKDPTTGLKADLAAVFS